MTDQNPRSDEPTPAADDPLAALLAEFAPEPPGGPTRARFWKYGFPAILAVMAMLAVVVSWSGLQAILDSNDGQLVRRVTDPSAVGYEAVVDKTPTDLLLVVDASGQLDSVLLLALTSPGIGGVMSIPASTQVSIPISSTVSVPSTLRLLFQSSGADATRAAAGELLNLSFTDSPVVRPEQWPDLVSRIAPLTVNNPSAVLGPNGREEFPKGSITLAATQVWPYLSTMGSNESDLDRLVRQQAFLRAMAASMGTAGADSITISTADGLGRYLAGLAVDRVTFTTLPVSAAPATAALPARFVLAAANGAIAVAPIVPFPEGAPGRRPRLRVLDGTGQLDNGLGASITLAAGGGQVDVVGNARTFGESVTLFVYYEPDQLAAAQAMRDVLGVGEVTQSSQTNSATDLTVVLGADQLDRSSTTTNGGPGA